MNKQPERISGVTMREQSEDVFKIFSQIAAATGGVVDASDNPEAAVRDALAVADASYLLSYRSSSSAAKGAFNSSPSGSRTAISRSLPAPDSSNSSSK